MRYFLDQNNRTRAINFDQESYIKVDWIELISLPPSQYHRAVIENGLHTGWEIAPENETKSLNEKKAALVTQLQKRLDDFARTRNYDGILSAASYATSTNPKFSLEGQYCVQLRDDTWAKAYQILSEVEAGTRPAPESIEDFESELPTMAWPNN